MKNIDKKYIILLLVSFLVLGFLNFSLDNKENKEIYAKETCVVDANIKDGFEIGKIPIGEAVDEAELFSQEIINEMENIYNEGLTQIDEVVLEEAEIDLQIEKVNELVGLTGPGSDNSNNCVDNSVNVPCNCYSSCYASGECDCHYIGGGDHRRLVCSAFYSLTCPGECSGSDPCPMGDINNIYNEIASYSNTALNYYNEVKEIYNKISGSNIKIKNMVGLIDLESEEDEEDIDLESLEDNLNRWKILNKFINAREKLELGKCILKDPKAKNKILSCETALFNIYVLRTLDTSGYFQDFSPLLSRYPYCYPYISEKVKPICKITANVFSNECREARKELMDNYFCCLSN